MTQVLIDRATLEQMTVALEDSIDCVRHEYETYWGHGLPTRKAQIDSMKESLDQHESAITAGRAALTNAEQQVPQWLPIETAPQNEKVLLACDGGIVIGMWRHYRIHNAPKFTHWMPLPAAPKDTP